jgi:hypothetical protein
MIRVILKGGLGNQMFQYSLGFALAKANKSELILDTTYLSDRTPRRGFTYRSYDLDVFGLDPEFTLLSKISRNLPIPLFWLGIDGGFTLIKNSFGIEKLIRESRKGFEPGVLEQKGNIVLFGYWQSWKYFKGCEDEIRNSFKFVKPLEGECKEMEAKIHSVNSVSIFVRRGDYLLPNNTALYGSTDAGYYQKAIGYVSEKIQNPHFFVFSDDLEWCRKELKFSAPATFVGEEYKGHKYTGKFRLMSSCKTHIVANSTFSWWSAWLSDHEDKMVVAPKRWFADSKNDISDIIPPEWITLE